MSTNTRAWRRPGFVTYTPGSPPLAEQPSLVAEFWIDQAKARTNGTQFVEKITVENKDGGKFVVEATFEKKKILEGGREVEVCWSPESVKVESHRNEDDALRKLTDKLTSGVPVRDKQKSQDLPAAKTHSDARAGAVNICTGQGGKEGHCCNRSVCLW